MPRRSKLDREALDIRLRVLGAGASRNTLSMGTWRTFSLTKAAMPTQKNCSAKHMDIQRRVLGPEHPETASSTYNVACVWRARASGMRRSRSCGRLSITGSAGVSLSPSKRIPIYNRSMATHTSPPSWPTPKSVPRLRRNPARKQSRSPPALTFAFLSFGSLLFSCDANRSTQAPAATMPPQARLAASSCDGFCLGSGERTLWPHLEWQVGRKRARGCYHLDLSARRAGGYGGRN